MEIPKEYLDRAEAEIKSMNLQEHIAYVLMRGGFGEVLTKIHNGGIKEVEEIVKTR